MAAYDKMFLDYTEKMKNAKVRGITEFKTLIKEFSPLGEFVKTADAIWCSAVGKPTNQPDDTKTKDDFFESLVPIQKTIQASFLIETTSEV